MMFIGPSIRQEARPDLSRLSALAGWLFFPSNSHRVRPMKIPSLDRDFQASSEMIQEEALE
jgi:hypothetical protein